VAQDVDEGVQESGAGTREHSEATTLELIQGPNAKLNRLQATFCPPIFVMTPGGQIMLWTQTRLGAKDQCKVATLIKRALSMGLISTFGQWKVHDHGNLLMTDAELDDRSKTEWETVFEKVGLIGPDAKQLDMNNIYNVHMKDDNAPLPEANDGTD
jgi:hypothetical protein